MVFFQKRLDKLFRKVFHRAKRKTPKKTLDFTGFSTLSAWFSIAFAENRMDYGKLLWKTCLWGNCRISQKKAYIFPEKHIEWGIFPFHVPHKARFFRYGGATLLLFGILPENAKNRKGNSNKILVISPGRWYNIIKEEERPSSAFPFRV